MKRTMIYALIFAVAAIGCEKTEDLPQASVEKLRISVSDNEYKSVFNDTELRTDWTSGDAAGVIHEYGYDNSGSVKYETNNSQQQFIISSATGASATMESDGAFNWVTPAAGRTPIAYRFYFYYPFNASTTNKGAVAGTLPVTQNYDMAGDWDVSEYDFMYAPSVELPDKLTPVVFASVNHVFSVFRIEFNNDGSSPVQISRIKLESESGNVLAGDFNAVISKGRVNECVNSTDLAGKKSNYGYFSDASSAITVNVSNGTVAVGGKGSVRMMINAAPIAFKDAKVKPFLGYNNAITYEADEDGIAPSEYSSDILRLTVTTQDDQTLQARFYGKDIARGATAVKKINISSLVPVAASCSNPVLEYYSERTNTSATFDITLPTDATAYKYLYKPLSDDAPSAKDVFDNGTAGTGSKFTISGLAPASAYRLYVVATAGNAYSAIVSAIFRTVGCPADYYEEGITIGSATYSKDTPGAVLIGDYPSFTAAGGVFFVAPGDYTASSSVTVTANTVFIGRYDNKNAPETRPTVTMNANNIDFLNIKNATSLIVIENCDFFIGRYLINQSNTPSCNNNIIVDNCNLKPNSAAYKASSIILTGYKGGFASESVRLSNNVIDLYNTTKMCADKAMIGFSSESGVADAFPKMKLIRIYNNSVLYSADKLSSSLLQLPDYNAENLEVEVFNNTVYNILPSTASTGYNGYICLGSGAGTTSIKKLVLNDNIFCISVSAGSSTAGYYSVVQNSDNAVSYTCSGNILYNKKTTSGVAFSDYAQFTILNPEFASASNLAPVAEGAALKGDPRWW